MSETPKERLQNAAEKLEAAASRLLDDIADPMPPPTIADPFSTRPVNFDDHRQIVREGIKEVRKHVDEIEEIVK